MKNKGFVAFMILVTISSFILIFQYLSSIEIFQFFDQVQRKQYREIAYYNAYSCINQALLGLSSDYFFKSNSEIKFDELNCSILSLAEDVNLSNRRIIMVSGKFKNIIVYRVATTRLFDDHIEIISIQ